MNFLVPVAFPYVITSRFNDYRDYSKIAPHRRQAHEGIDFAPKSGVSKSSLRVVAAQDGDIVKVGYQANGYGHYMLIRHDDRYDTWYCHLKEAPSKTSGFVSMGETIGYAGTTGYSSGTHLHFNICDHLKGLDNYVVDDVVDPEPLMIWEPPSIIVVRGVPLKVVNSAVKMRLPDAKFEVK